MQPNIAKQMPAKSSNRFYVSNRPPLLPSPLVKLPLGAVRPRGWLKHMLDLMVEGMTGRLTELSQFLAPDNGWFGGDNPGWEEQPYWFRGFHDLAVLTGSERLAAEAKRWIDAVLAGQDADGWFGAKHHKCLVGKNGAKVCDLWPAMIMLDAVIHHHEHTADERVVPFARRFFEFCRGLPDDMFLPKPDNWGETFGTNQPVWQRWRGGDMLPHIYWLYNHTGEAWLLELATRFFRRMAPPQDEWLDHHIVNFTQRFAYAGIYYQQSQERWHLEQPEYWYRQHMSAWGQQPRGIFGADETIRPGCVDPRQAFETCGFVEFNKNFYLLGRATGDPLYADRSEDITLNHFPASQTPDLKALHYLTAANQPQLDAAESHEYRNRGRMTCYSPHIYRCCQHNVAMGWPWYVQNLWQATADDGLAAWLYGACDVTARVGNGAEVSLEVRTDYPFGGEVTVMVRAPQPAAFPLYLRVPGWCEDFSVAVNGRRQPAEPEPGSFVRLQRTWHTGDRIDIEMAMDIALTRWPRNGSVTVDRGPLSYSLKIGESWRRCGGTDEWPEWEVYPTTPWNYGLVLNRWNAAASLHVKHKGAVAPQPWTPAAAPIEIAAKGRRIPGWGIENNTVQQLRPGPVLSSEPEEDITLIPLGCARLRMSCLPVIGDGPQAREWA